MEAARPFTSALERVQAQLDQRRPARVEGLRGSSRAWYVAELYRDPATSERVARACLETMARLPSPTTRAILLETLEHDDAFRVALALDGVALRRTRDGRRTLSFPARRDRQGRDHPYVRPLSTEARSAIERQVLDALGLEPEVRP